MPPAGPPREEGFSKDADKLIRRLSLVAFLLSRPDRPATAGEIRQRVEGYALMTDDAFKRRFYEDRAELAALGIGVAADGEGDTELYCLPASAYYLPAIELTPDELSALAACLFVLEHRFAYSEPLRLALLSLTHGRPELLFPATATPVSVLPQREAQRAAGALPKLQQAVAAGKTVTFDYYSIGRDEQLARTVDPYGLLLVGDEWYLVAWCHLRQAIRTFRLSRLRSRVGFATRAPHDFAAPAGFSIDAYLDRPPWQLGESAGSAAVRVTADMAWWVEAHFSRCGTIAVATGAAMARPAAKLVRPAAATASRSSSRPPTTRRGSWCRGCCRWARRPSCSNRLSCEPSCTGSSSGSPSASLTRRSMPSAPPSCSTAPPFRAGDARPPPAPPTGTSKPTASRAWRP